MSKSTVNLTYVGNHLRKNIKDHKVTPQGTSLRKLLTMHTKNTNSMSLSSLLNNQYTKERIINSGINTSIPNFVLENKHK